MSVTLGSMNPIALVETTTATRRAVLGALATDPVLPTGKKRPEQGSNLRPGPLGGTPSIGVPTTFPPLNPCK